MRPGDNAVVLPTDREKQKPAKGPQETPRRDVKDNGALACGDVTRRDERLPGIRFGVAVQREQALAAQAIDFGQVETDAGLLERGEPRSRMAMPSA